MLRRIMSIYDNIINFLVILAGIILVCMVLIMAAAILLRYLGYPIGWAVEIGKYSIYYIALLVAAWVLKEEGHIGIEILVSQFKKKTQSFVHGITSFISAIPCFIFTWFGAKVTWEFFISGYFEPTYLELPHWIMTIMIPIGFFLLGIQFVRRGINFFNNYRSDLVRMGRR